MTAHNSLERKRLLRKDPEMKATEYVDGRKFVRWLEEDCHEELTGLSIGETMLRRVYSMRRDGSVPSIYTCDKILTSLGRHISEIPDDCYCETTRGRSDKGVSRQERIEIIYAAWERVNGGENLSEVSRDVGLNPRTLLYWRDKLEIEDKRPSRSREQAA